VAFFFFNQLSQEQTILFLASVKSVVVVFSFKFSVLEKKFFMVRRFFDWLVDGKQNNQE